MLMLGLNETIDQMAMGNNVHWYSHVLRRDFGHVLRREDGHVLRRLEFEVECQRMEVWPNRKKQVEEENVEVGLSREDTLFRSKWIVEASQIADRLK